VRLDSYLRSRSGRIVDEKKFILGGQGNSWTGLYRLCGIGMYGCSRAELPGRYIGRQSKHNWNGTRQEAPDTLSYLDADGIKCT